MAICKNKKCSIGECDQTEDCAAYVPVISNADRIRAMSDEELIELFGKNGLCDYVQEHSRNHCEKHGSCNGCLLEWLKKTAE